MAEIRNELHDPWPILGLAPVSVVIPCFRDAATLEFAIASVYGQTLTPRQVIVVDDASEDEATATRLREMEVKFGDRGLEVVALQNNGGPSVARNCGWDRATQEFVAFLDADDRWHPRKVQLQLALMTSAAKPSLSGHVVRVGAIASEAIPDELSDGDVRTIDTSQLLRRNRFATSSVMVRRELTERFNVKRRRAEDYELWLRIALRGETCVHMQIPLTSYCKEFFGDGGLSSQLVQMEIAEIDVYRALRKDRLISATACGWLMAWSGMRFFRRVLIVMLRKTKPLLRRATDQKVAQK